MIAGGPGVNLYHHSADEAITQRKLLDQGLLMKLFALYYTSINDKVRNKNFREPARYTLVILGALAMG